MENRCYYMKKVCKNVKYLLDDLLHLVNCLVNLQGGQELIDFFFNANFVSLSLKILF